MWVLLLASLLIVSANGLNLTGEHICQQEERYTVNVTHNVQKNATIRVYVWCLNIPPRCSTFKFKTYNEKQVVEEERVRQVPICCEGYEPDTAGENCVPQCKHCVNGVCDDEHKCYCHPGYRGDHCERGCEFARWGRYCRYHCTCERGECDPKNGHCECPSGWTGTRCEQQCPLGHFGLQCRNICQCGDEEICNPSDGRCLSKDKYLEDISQSKTPTSRKHNPFGISTLNTRKPVPKPSSSGEQTDTKKIVGVYVLTTTEAADDIVTTTIDDNSILNIKSSTDEQISNNETNPGKLVSIEDEVIINNEKSLDFLVTVKTTDHELSDFRPSTEATDHELTLNTKSDFKPSTEATSYEMIEIVSDNTNEHEENDFVFKSTPSVTTIEQESNDQKSSSAKEIFTTPSNSIRIVKTDRKSKSMHGMDVITTSVNYDTTTSRTHEQLSPDIDIIQSTTTSRKVIKIPLFGGIMKKPPTNRNSVEVTAIYNDVMENETEAFVEVMKRNILSEKKSSGDAFTRDKDEYRHSFTRSALIGIVSAAITICILLIGAGLYTTARIKEKHRKQVKIKEACAGVSHSKEYSFSAKSIFHFPLPDPPDHYNDNTIKRLDSNTTFKSNPAKTSESTYKTSIDYLELFYDQPPSRGTYRAASVPEPPSLKEAEIPEITVEPIYDEIPSWAEDAGPVYANSNQEEVTKF